MSAEPVRWPAARRVAIRLGVLVVSVAVALALVELTLHAIRFEYHLYPSLQFGWPTPYEIHNVYKPEPELFWVTRDFHEKLARAKQSHPSVVFLGDSCTEWGTYPAKTLERLSALAPELATGVKFGIGGWTSEQGLWFLRRDILALKPKIVTIYYGWNDHWVALGPTDADLTSSRRLLHWSERWRLPQLLLKTTIARSPSNERRPNRVPLERYRANLTMMIREAKGHGIQPVVITAPSNHVAGREPEYLKLRHVRALSEVVPLHTAYVEATREVAATQQATLCDAADAFSRLPGSRSTFIRTDGIHLTDPGDSVLADMLARCIVAATPSRTSAP